MRHRLWKLLEKTRLFATPRGIEVFVEKVELPDGRVIDDFYTLVKPDAAIVAAETADGEFVVLRQYQHGPRAIGLTVPGGLIDPGEDALAAAQRELLEETGYASDDWTAIGKYSRDPTQGYGYEFYFHARNVQKIEEPAPDDYEEMETLLLTRDQLKQALLDGDVLALPEAMIFARMLLV